MSVHKLLVSSSIQLAMKPATFANPLIRIMGAKADEMFRFTYYLKRANDGTERLFT